MKEIHTIDFVAFDTETTGIHPTNDSLVELAAIRFNLKTGPKEYFQTLINPLRPIPAGAMRIHGISDEMVAKSPTLKQILPQFIHFAHDSVLVAHNAPFDTDFISMAAHRFDMELPELFVLDTLPFARKTIKNVSSYGLENLVHALKISSTKFHRALADTQSCMELFCHLVEKSCGKKASWDELLKIHGNPLNLAKAVQPLEEVPTAFMPLLNALRNEEMLYIEYEGSFGPRAITPLSIYAKGKRQYLDATCHIDGIRKSFRLDRIQKVHA